MSTLRDKVLAECKAWANTDEDFDSPNPPKEHPGGWQIWELEDRENGLTKTYYEFHRGEIDGNNEEDFYEYFPNSEYVEDRSDVVAEMLGITLEDIKP